MSISRIISIPFLIFLIFFGLHYIALTIFLINIVSDILDGYIARKFDTCSKKGAFLDVIGDFSFIFSSIIGLTFIGTYPFWLLVIVVFIFLQFLLTSKNKEVRYDPLGKYYGSFLMLIITITLVDIETILLPVILIGFMSYTALSISSRILFLNIRK